MTTVLIERELKNITKRVRNLLGYINKSDLGIELNITQNTLRSRLDKHDWTYAEVLIIENLVKKHIK